MEKRAGRLFGVAALLCAAALLGGCQAYKDGNSRTVGEFTDDMAIQANVKGRLVNDDEIAGLKIDTAVYKGVVTLRGEVPNAAIRARALDIARGIKGVTQVDNQLRVAQ